MKTQIKLMVLAVSLVLAGTAGAASVSVSPGGNTALAGTASFQVNNTNGSIDYSGSCPMSMQANFNASTASFTVNSIDFGSPCGQYGGYDVGVVQTFAPWSGTTTGIASTVWRSTISGARVELEQVDGFNPRWAADCTNSVAFNVSWVSNGLLGAPATSVTSNGLKKFATTAGGRQCYISFTLYLSPFQTFTTHP